MQKKDKYNYIDIYIPRLLDLVYWTGWLRLLKVPLLIYYR